MPLPLTVSCFSKIQIGLVPAHPGNPGQSSEGHKMGVCVWGEEGVTNTDVLYICGTTGIEAFLLKAQL